MRNFVAGSSDFKIEITSASVSLITGFACISTDVSAVAVYSLLLAQFGVDTFSTATVTGVSKKVLGTTIRCVVWSRQLDTILAAQRCCHFGSPQNVFGKHVAGVRNRGH